MTTPRKQLSSIAADHLKHADNALAAATALHEQALQQQHRDIAAILERISDRNTLVGRPDYILEAIQRIRRYHDQAQALHWQAQALEEKAKRLLIAAQHAH